MDPAQRHRVADLAQGIVLGNVLFPVAVFVLAVLSLRLGCGIAPWIFYVAVAPWCLGVWWLLSPRGEAVRVITCSLAITCVSLITAWFLYDYSWDGLWYHQEAILRLAEGWNPISGDAVDYGSKNLWGAALWINHYPKASWLIGASVFKAFGAIEPGKFINFSLMSAAGFQIWAVLLRLTDMRPRYAAAIALLAALNPVTLGELSSFTVDGVVASLLTILIGACVVYAAKPERSAAAVIFGTVCLLINIKFTGLVYGVVLSGFGVAACLGLRRWRPALNLAAGLAATGLVSLLVLGWSPYVRNVRENGDLFYPLRGKEPVDIMTPIRPANLVDKDRFSRFLIANFSRCEQVRPPLSTSLKFPLVVFPAEFRVWRTNDPEAGGFGPWFGAMLLCTLVAIILLFRDQRSRRTAVICGLVTLGILATTFIHTEGWLARYAPQTWLVPLVWIIGLLAGLGRAQDIFGKVMLAMLSANLVFIAVAWFGWNVLYGVRMHKCLREMAAAPQPIAVEFGEFQALRERLREVGVQYQVVNPPPAPANTTRIRIPTNGEQAYWYQPEPATNDVTQK